VAGVLGVEVGRLFDLDPLDGGYAARRVARALAARAGW
jgi:hypothetical protein